LDIVKGGKMLKNNNFMVVRVQGEEVDFIGKQGTTWGPILIVIKADGVPVDLTGHKVRGQMRKNLKSTEAAPGLSFAITSAVAGQVSMSNDAASTAALSCGTKHTDPESLYYWDMEIYKDAVPDPPAPEEVSRFIKGKIYIDAEVTKI
jgi:hypothetical protein